MTVLIMIYYYRMFILSLRIVDSLFVENAFIWAPVPLFVLNHHWSNFSREVVLKYSGMCLLSKTSALLMQLTLCIYFQKTIKSDSCISEALCLCAPFTKMELTSIPAWISNHTSSKVWHEITYSSPNFELYLHFIMSVITHPFWD